MKSNTLISLLLALIVASGLSYWLLQDDMQQTQASTSVLGDFKPHLAAVTQIDIRDHQGELLSAELVNGEWVATHLQAGLQFPADRNLLVGLINGLSSATLYQAKTQNPQNYSQLSVEDIGSEDAQSRLLTLTAGENSFSILVGNTATSGLGSFVRFPEQSQSWLIDQRLNVPSDAQQWLLNPLSLMSIEQVSSAFRDGEGAWQVVRDDALDEQTLAPLTLTDKTEQENYQFPNVVSNSLSAMLTARFDAISVIDSVTLSDSPSATLTFSASDNELSILLYNIEEQYYAVYVSASDPWLSDWIFELSSFTYNQLNKQRDDFVEVPEAEGPPSPNEQLPIDEGEAPDGE